MSRPLRLLLVEDSEDDMLLLLRELRRGNYAPAYQRVETLEAMQEALLKQAWDIVIADYAMPHFSGLRAIEVLQKSGLDLPFILVSGTIGEEVAVMAMKAGAHDYIMKGNLTRLVPAVERELREAEERRERKKADAALAAETERLAVTLRAIGDAVITTDTEGKITLINQVAENLTGWTQREAVGQPVTKVFRAIDQKFDELLNPVEAVLQKGEIVELPNPSILIGRDEIERMIAGVGTPINDTEGRTIGAVLAIRDVTQEQKMTEELLKATKLESLSVLAGGIAHDFNNILTVIIGNLSMSRLYTSPEDEMNSFLEEAERASFRARDLTQQLLTFAKGGVPIKRAALLSEMVKESVQFMMHGSNVESDFALADDLWPVEVDKGQLSRVIQNLVINAVQAMPEGGRLQVQAKNIWLNEKTDVPLSPGQYIEILVRDQGTGIPPENLSRIFDPYFTTKTHGSGLGLATSSNIIKKHGGHLAVESHVGVGTTFRIYLPASNEEVKEETNTEGALLAGEGRILVMDDEAAIRDLTALMLQRLGYEVETVKDGAEALGSWWTAKALGKPFKAILMDLTVPGGMGAKEVMRKFEEMGEKVKVVVSSGYPNDPVMGNYREFGFSGVVSKPYKLQELGLVLQQVLTS